MLQHAFSMALFPEHQVQITETIPDPDMVREVDVVIVDAGALREQDSLHDRELLAVQSWRTPTIWIEPNPPSPAPAREKLLLFKQAIAKEALQKALAECLGANSAVKQPASSAAAERDPRAQVSQEAQADKTVIELVDVVEEGSARGRSRTRQKK
jgi:hypothetical protein